MQPIVATAPYERMVIDLVDLNDYVSENDGERYLMNCIDAFSQFVWSFTLKEKTCEGVLTCLLRIFEIFGGPPKILQSDNGGEFIGGILKKQMEELGVKVINSSAYHPQSQGRVERLNMTFEIQLGKMVEELQGKRWIDHLPQLVQGYNCTKHATTNRTPYEAMFVRPPPAFWMDKLPEKGSQYCHENLPQIFQRLFKKLTLIQLKEMLNEFETLFTKSWRKMQPE
jgi:transposase InsO family protein